MVANEEQPLKKLLPTSGGTFKRDNIWFLKKVVQIRTPVTEDINIDWKWPILSAVEETDWQEGIHIFLKGHYACRPYVYLGLAFALWFPMQVLFLGPLLQNVSVSVSVTTYWWTLPAFRIFSYPFAYSLLSAFNRSSHFQIRFNLLFRFFCLILVN